VSTFKELALKVAQQSPCRKRKVGCVVYRGHIALSAGFNHGYVEPCFCSHETKNPHVLHAEAMALARNIDFTGASIYVTHPPCLQCAELIIEKGIIHASFPETRHPTPGALTLLRHGCSIELG